MAKAIEIERQMLTIEEVATFVGLHRATVLKAFESGQIPAQRIAKKWLCHKANLEAWARQGAEGRRGGEPMMSEQVPNPQA